MRIRVTLLLSLGFIAVNACRCGPVLVSQASAEIIPPVFEFGPITKGSKCNANLKVKNTGTEDLQVASGTLESTVGNFVLSKVPTQVRLGNQEDLIVAYTAGNTVGKIESTNIKLQTDEKKDNGVLRGSVTAIVVDAAAPTAKSQCGTPPASPCKSLDFGPTQKGGAGITLGVTIINDGTADLHIQPGGAVIQNTSGDGEFTIQSVTLGTTVVTDFQQNGVKIPPTRSSDCGKPTGSTVTATINVTFVPSKLGAAVDTLTVLTDAISSDGKTGGEVDVPLSGVGSDVGILIDPDTINFGALGEGQTQTIKVVVSNEGTSEASVNEACIALTDPNTCDAGCDGQGTSTLNGTLTCKVTKSDGTTLESLGFRLGPTDAQQGGDDERDIFVTWAPVAGTDSIPTTAVLALQSNIIGNKVFTAELIGGSVGVLEFSTTDGVCPDGSSGLCVHTTGTACTCPPTGGAGDCNLPTDTETWHGTATATFKNTGAASVNVSSLELQCPGGQSIASEYTLGTISSSTIAPNDSATVSVTFQNAGAACVAPCNLIAHHDGAGGQTTVPMDIVPPQ